MMCIRGVDVITQTGFSTALIQRPTGFEEAKHTAFTLMVLRGFVLALILIVSAPFVASFFGEPDVRHLLSVLAVTFIFSGFLNIDTVRNQKELDFKALVYLDQARTIISFILVLAFAFYYRNIWALVIAHVISAFLHVILSYRIIKGRIDFQFNKRIAWELFHYGKFITGLSIVVYLTSEIDNAVIGKILGVETLGFYVLAYTLANLPATHFSKVLSNVLMPAYSKLQDDLPALEAALSRVIRFIALTTIPMSFIMIVLADNLVTVVYGDRWAAAAAPLQVLAVLGMLRAITSVNGYLYNAIGKPNIPFYLNLAKLVVIAILIVPLTLAYGIEGTAIAITIPMFVQFFVGFRIICNVISANYMMLLGELTRIVLLSAVAALVILGLKQQLDAPTVTNLVALLAISALTFSVLLFKELREAVLFFARSNR